MRPLGLLCAIVLVGGCSNATSVRPFGGTYDLISVDGKPDPQPLFSGANTDVVAGTLTVGSDTLNVILDLKSVDSAGRPTGDATPLVNAIPYVRRGDTLLVADSGSLGDGFGGLTSGAFPIGKIVGSSVQLDLTFGIPASTGFGGPPGRFLFTPAP